MPTISELVTDALMELGATSPGMTVPGHTQVLGLNRINRILDTWNAERPAAYRDTFTNYTLTANLQPHTIGPSNATWSATVRPVSITGANLVLNTTTPSTHVPINLRNAQWWLQQRVPGTTTTIPLDLYYEPSWPNGSVYLWPVPTVAYEVQLRTRQLLASVALGDTFALPPGYQEALTLTLAESMAPSVSQVVSPQTAMRAAEARAAIFSNNSVPRQIQTQDAGMPRAGDHGTQSNWNYDVGEGD